MINLILEQYESAGFDVEMHERCHFSLYIINKFSLLTFLKGIICYYNLWVYYTDSKVLYEIIKVYGNTVRKDCIFYE